MNRINVSTSHLNGSFSRNEAEFQNGGVQVITEATDVRPFGVVVVGRVIGVIGVVGVVEAPLLKAERKSEIDEGRGGVGGTLVGP